MEEGNARLMVYGEQSMAQISLCEGVGVSIIGLGEFGMSASASAAQNIIL